MRTTTDTLTGKPFRYNEIVHDKTTGLRTPGRQNKASATHLDPSRVPLALLQELNPDVDVVAKQEQAKREHLAAVEPIWADEDNELPLTGGGMGQPGCDCGMADAMAKVGGEFLCEAELIARGLAIKVSLKIENTYELYEDVTTHVTDKVMPAPPAEADSEEHDVWLDEHILPLCGVGEDHSRGDSWYQAIVTACSDPALVGREFEFGY